MKTTRCDIAIVGSGFAGTLLARALRSQGRSVALVERGRHPRFAIGESSTPLANLSMERLGARYGLEDLRDLASYGRWTARLPQLRRGLKRGFTFYDHRQGELFRNGPSNDRRLLVAASPDDEVADTHWLRSDIDHYFVQRAVQEGVEFQEQSDIESVQREDGAWILRGRGSDGGFEVRAGFLVDGSGEGGFLATALGIPSALDRVGIDTRIVFGHFEGVESFQEVAAAGGAHMDRGPYPDEKAAVHHLLDDAWMYVLPFDHGLVSAGFILRRDGQDYRDLATLPAEVQWDILLKRYPSLAGQFEGASPTRPIEARSRVQRRLKSATGGGWAMLPHSFAFLDPLYSTGIAWSLRGVERLAEILGTTALGGGDESGVNEAVSRYGSMLQEEADEMDLLMRLAWRSMFCFDLFVSVGWLYFCSVSFSEVEQRLEDKAPDGRPWHWQGFLTTSDPVLGPVIREAADRLAEVPRSGQGGVDREHRDKFGEWVSRAIVARNVAGLADAERRNLYPVDMDVLIARAGLLGRDSEFLRAAASRLRGLA